MFSGHFACHGHRGSKSPHHGLEESVLPHDQLQLPYLSKPIIIILWIMIDFLACLYVGGGVRVCYSYHGNLALVARDVDFIVV